MEAPRRELIQDLRALADMLEQCPDVPTPYPPGFAVWVTEEQARTARAAIRASARWSRQPWQKTNQAANGYVSYRLPFRPDGDVAFTLYVPKTEKCVRKQVGTRHVDSYDEPVYEWDCSGKS